MRPPLVYILHWCPDCDCQGLLESRESRGLSSVLSETGSPPWGKWTRRFRTLFLPMSRLLTHQMPCSWTILYTNLGRRQHAGCYVPLSIRRPSRYVLNEMYDPSAFFPPFPMKPGSEDTQRAAKSEKCIMTTAEIGVNARMDRFRMQHDRTRINLRYTIDFLGSLLRSTAFNALFIRVHVYVAITILQACTLYFLLLNYVAGKR